MNTSTAATDQRQPSLWLTLGPVITLASAVVVLTVVGVFDQPLQVLAVTMGAIVLLTFAIQLATRQPAGFLRRTVHTTAVGGLIVLSGVAVQMFVGLGA